MFGTNLCISTTLVFVVACVSSAWAVPKPSSQAFLTQQALDALAQRAAPIAGMRSFSILLCKLYLSSLKQGSTQAARSQPKLAIGWQSFPIAQNWYT